MRQLPSGTITFLFTDIEGSTTRWEQVPAEMAPALLRHDRLLRDVIEAGGGVVFKTVGDAVCAAFPVAPIAVEAAAACQQALATESWGDAGALLVRMALHSGQAEERDADYFGPAVNRVARILSAGHGGQVLVSAATHELVRDTLSASVGLRDLGEHRLKDLARAEHLYQLIVPGLRREFPPLKSLDRQPNNLPVQLTPLIGREREVAATRETLLGPGARLLTLTGPGGIGKTRLGLQAAAELTDAFLDGVWFVDLSSIEDPALVAVEIARTLGVREAGGLELAECLGEYLRHRQLLLLLDNFEQVTEAAPLIAGLLRTCPTLKALVTSRVRLRVTGERELLVPPLPLPTTEALATIEQATQCEAVRLFMERAQAVNPDFTVTPLNAAAVGELCQRLDGLPLAIELAAAWVRLFSPKALAARLETCLPLLTGGGVDLPERQRTMRAAIAWSYDLLPPAEQRLFERLALFAGGCTLDVAEAVCTQVADLELDMLQGVASLTDKSLLRRTEGADGEPRFGMLATVREFGLEQLAASGVDAFLRRSLVEHFLALAEEAEPRLGGPEQGLWLARLEDEHDNLRAALAWSLEEDPTAALRMAGALWRFWRNRGHLSEGRVWLERALAQSGDVPAKIRAKALTGAGALAEQQGDYGSATARYQGALALFEEIGDPRGRAESLDRLGNVAHDQGDYARAVDLHGQALTEFRRVGDTLGSARSLSNLGTARLFRGEFGPAETAYSEALNLHRVLGDEHGVSIVLNNLGALVFRRGEYVRAKAFYEESLSLRRRLGDKRGTGVVLVNLGETLERQGAMAAAVALYQDALDLLRKLGDKRGTAHALACLGRLEWERTGAAQAQELLVESLRLYKHVGDKAEIAERLEDLAGVANGQGFVDRAVRMLGAADALRDSVGAARPAAEGADFARHVAKARASLDEARFAQEWEAGRSLSLDQAIAEAMGGGS